MGMSPLPPPMGPYDRGAPPTSPRRRVKARQLVCEVFDRSARGQGKSGPLVLENGDANVPSVVRKLGSVAAVEHALTPPTPSEVAAAAHRYIDAQLDLVTAAMAYVAPTRLMRSTASPRPQTTRPKHSARHADCRVSARRGCGRLE